jgi:hypothetical protein
VNVGSSNFRDASSVCDLLQTAADLLRDHPGRDGCCVTLPARGRLLATGDLHDNPLHFAAVQSLARLDDSPDHHVTLHELIHGERLINNIDLSHRMLCKTAAWIVQHPTQVHPLLANHELCQMTGRGVSKGAGDSVKLFNDGLDYAFGDDAESVAEAIAIFVRAMPLALRTESGLLCAHALPGPATLRLFDPSILSRSLTDAYFAAPRGGAYLMVWGRGWTDDVVASLSSAWNVSAFILGHQHADDGAELVGERILVLNTDHDRGRVVTVDLTQPPNLQELLGRATSIRAHASATEPQA